MDRRDWLTAKPGEVRPRVPKALSGVGSAAHVSVKWAEVNPDTGVMFPDVCPGWAVCQPLVGDVAMAHAAFTAGELATCFPNPSNVLIEGVLEMQRSYDDYSRQLTARPEEMEIPHG